MSTRYFLSVSIGLSVCMGECARVHPHACPSLYQYQCLCQMSVILSLKMINQSIDRQSNANHECLKILDLAGKQAS